jgi:RimJ/RimL family protein N-acetyltransferase
MMFPDTLPTITTERLVLRGLVDRDSDAVFSIFSHPDVMRYWHTPAMADIQESRTFIAQARSSFSQHTAIRWGLAHRNDDRIIGTCILFHLDDQNRRVEIGYALGREYWGNGFNYEAIKSLLNYAFCTLSLNRLEAETDPRNTASIRTLTRLGFVQEGVLRERCFVNGETSDSLFMGLLRKEWQVET